MTSLATKLKVGVLTLLLGVTAFTIAPDALAQGGEDITKTCTQWQIDQGVCNPGFRALALQLLNWFLLFLGLIATAFLIFGGFQYVTSAGNDQNIEKAKKVIIYAAVGILVVLVSAVLVNALIGSATNATGE